VVDALKPCKEARSAWRFPTQGDDWGEICSQREANIIGDEMNSTSHKTAGRGEARGEKPRC